eukprot:TRINITY_DN8210_c0_g1_i1.p1 TRINITY_DN8210_c0_g1~~TRINITY_DN8210_c0_g1_i1.p1  ORF type:complete len:358 (-),score=83.77 TRINITY_DN8210_c0_g1_i1:254-1327(-)
MMLKSQISLKRKKSAIPESAVNVIADDYTVDGELGRGMFGVVYRAKNKTGEVFAIKEVDTSVVDKSSLPTILREADIMKDLDHVNIVKLHRFIRQGSIIFFVLEYVDSGNLYQLWKKYSGLKEGMVAQFTKQTLHGLTYIHGKNIIHRDIKASNLLLTSSGVVKLADFGTSKADDANKNFTMIGTPYWMAPEIISSSNCSTLADIWSLGCTVIEMMTGKPPYYDLNQMRALFSIVENDCPPLPSNIISPALKDFLVHGCFVKDIMRRAPATLLLRHVWITSASPQMGIDEIDSILGENKKKEKISPVSPTSPQPPEETRKELEGKIMAITLERDKLKLENELLRAKLKRLTERRDYS